MEERQLGKDNKERIATISLSYLKGALIKKFELKYLVLRWHLAEWKRMNKSESFSKRV